MHLGIQESLSDAFRYLIASLESVSKVLQSIEANSFHSINQGFECKYINFLKPAIHMELIINCRRHENTFYLYFQPNINNKFYL